jgi:hypothetical protein
MADELNEDGTPKVPATPVTPTVKPDQAEIDRLVQAGIDAALKPVKEKLDAAYAKRDAADAKIAEYERIAREAELKRLTDEGKHKEAADLQVAEERRKREEAEKKVISLTRDVEVRSVLGTQDFRNENALEMAYKEIVGQLIQNESGAWVHRSGVTVKDFVKTFADSEDNAFLFKAKASSGGGSTPPKGFVPPPAQVKSLFDMTQDEVIKLAEAGKLRNRK